MEPIEVNPGFVMDGATFYVTDRYGQGICEPYLVKIRGFDSPPKGSKGYDVAREKLASFLKEHGTLYLIGEMDKVGEEPKVYYVCTVLYPHEGLSNLLEDLADYMKEEGHGTENVLSVLEDEIPL